MLKSESFLELPWPFLLTLVSDGELQVDEAELFKAVQGWVSRDPTERRNRVDEVRICKLFYLLFLLHGTHKVVCCSVAWCYHL